MLITMRVYMKFLTFLGMNLIGCLCENATVENGCNNDALAVYKVTLDGNWSKDLFPKHFPENRPKASFSKSFGQSHDANYSLFRIGKVASSSLKSFCQTAQSIEFENEESSEEYGIFDEFHIPKLMNPMEVVESKLFVNNNFSMVSMITKILPSPDWFIGIDTLNLCRHNRWVENLTIEAFPFDCGINSGLTFSAPVWPTDPQDPIQKITPKYPRHQASSFYYNDMKHLPPIAFFRFQKIKEYVGVKEKSIKRIQQKFRRHDKHYKEKTKLANERRNMRLKFANRKKQNQSNETINSTTVLSSREEYISPDCQVTEWSTWSECSVKCGLGEKHRSRTIVKQPKIGGHSCPKLREIMWCGSARDHCPRNGTSTGESIYFKW